MFGLRTTGKSLVKKQWQHQLSEYVTAVIWSPSGWLGASTAAGEICLWQENYPTQLLKATEQSIDCLAFSFDGKFLAAGGQDGKVRIWSCQNEPELITTLDNRSKWIDKLSWHPHKHELAFSLGRYVQIWNAEIEKVVSTLSFANSSVLDISWQPNGETLAIAGDGGVKVWNAKDWDEDPYVIELPAASNAIAWSDDSQYLAANCFDFTVYVWSWGIFHLWVMRGFPGKIRNLTWSGSTAKQTPLLAASSVEGVVVWTQQKNKKEGDTWNGQVLDIHEGIVQDLSFQSNSLLLASVGDDGCLCLWQGGKHLAQIEESVTEGFSCLAWNACGDRLAAGGQNGEVVVWQEVSAAKGFGNKN
jgi:WD40 repeat protein